MPTQPRPPLIVRLRPGQQLALDCLAAGIYGFSAWVLFTHKIGSGLLAVAGTAAICVAVALARRRPLAAFAVALAAFWLTPLAAILGFVALAPMTWALFRVAARYRTRSAIAILAISMTGPLATALPGFVHAGGVIPFATLFITAWTAGYAAGRNRRYGEELLRHHVRQAEADLEQARRGVAEERIRIARELHDIVAHSMSVITVQAGFGHLVIDSKPAEARAALGAIEVTGRETLIEMRRLLGVLRDEDQHPRGALPSLAPAPGLADLDQLVTLTAKAGVHVRLTVTGEPRALPPGIDFSAYRIVQEALTNVVRHAAATTACAAISYRPDELAIEITDNGRGCSAAAGPGGHGLIGMRERVSMYGGTLHAAPLPEHGFHVTARLPLAARGAATGSPA